MTEPIEITVETTDVPEAHVFEAYNVPLRATSNTGSPVTWRLHFGELPYGLAVEESCITGTPRSVMERDVSFFVEDRENAAQTTATLRLRVRP